MGVCRAAWFPLYRWMECMYLVPFNGPLSCFHSWIFLYEQYSLYIFNVQIIFEKFKNNLEQC